MPVPWVLLLVAAALAGCASEATETPVLGNPKLLVDRTSDNQTQVYVHGAFGDRVYDRLRLDVDNATVAEERETYALLHRTAAQHLHLRVEAEAGSANYTIEALVRMTDDGAEVALFDGEAFEEFRETGLPWQKIVEAARPPDEEGDA